MTTHVMTPRERVIAQIGHQETSPVPYSLGFEGDVAERLDVYYGSVQWRQTLDNAICRAPCPNLVVEESDAPTYTDHFGAVWRIDRRPFHLETPAILEPTMEGFQWPDLDALYDDEWLKSSTQVVLDDPDHFYVAGFGFGIYERTWALRGFDEALMDAAGDPDFYDELVEQIAVHQLDVIERLLKLPVHGIMFSDDWGYQQGVLLGPERWRRFIKPRLARMYDLVHASGRYTLSHCCGSIVDIMPDIIEIGLDVIESVQPEARGMDPFALKAEYGQDITFWGGLGSQSTIPFGTPSEIRGMVHRLCTVMGKDGGYILGPAKALQPETSTENAVAVVEAFMEQ